MCIDLILCICSSFDASLGCFHLLTLVNTAMDMGVQIRLWVHTLSAFGSMPTDGCILRYIYFNFFPGISILFSIIIAPFYNLTNSVRVFPRLVSHLYSNGQEWFCENRAALKIRMASFKLDQALRTGLISTRWTSLLRSYYFWTRVYRLAANCVHNVGLCLAGLRL